MEHVNNHDELPGQPLFFSYADGGFNSVDWLSLPYSDDEPIWDNYLSHRNQAEWKFVVGAKPATYTRVWATVGKARHMQIEARKPPMTFSQFVNAMAEARGITALELMDIDYHTVGGRRD